MIETTRTDPVGRALLPVLLHEVNNTTQLLVGLRALLEIPGGDELFAQRADDLARASEQMHDLGFAMAVVATGSGADMLMSRRHPRGVAILWELAARALERRGDLRVERTGTPPELVPGALDGWQAPWSVAALLIEVERATGLAGWRWEWTDDGALVGRCASPPSASAFGGALDGIVERAPGLTIQCTDTGLEWRVPADWIRTATG